LPSQSPVPAPHAAPYPHRRSHSVYLPHLSRHSGFPQRSGDKPEKDEVVPQDGPCSPGYLYGFYHRKMTVTLSPPTVMMSTMLALTEGSCIMKVPVTPLCNLSTPAAWMLLAVTAASAVTTVRAAYAALEIAAVCEREDRACVVVRSSVISSFTVGVYDVAPAVTVTAVLWAPCSDIASTIAEATGGADHVFLSGGVVLLWGKMTTTVLSFSPEEEETMVVLLGDAFVTSARVTVVTVVGILGPFYIFFGWAVKTNPGALSLFWGMRATFFFILPNLRRVGDVVCNSMVGSPRSATSSSARHRAGCAFCAICTHSTAAPCTHGSTRTAGGSTWMQ